MPPHLNHHFEKHSPCIGLRKVASHAFSAFVSGGIVLLVCGERRKGKKAIFRCVRTVRRYFLVGMVTPHLVTTTFCGAPKEILLLSVSCPFCLQSHSLLGVQWQHTSKSQSYCTRLLDSIWKIKKHQKLGRRLQLCGQHPWRLLLCFSATTIQSVN